MTSDDESVQTSTSHRELSPAQQTIPLRDLRTTGGSTERALSSSSSLPRSIPSPTSTPVTSIRPSFSSQERPPSYAPRSQNTTSDRTVRPSSPLQDAQSEDVTASGHDAADTLPTNPQRNEAPTPTPTPSRDPPALTLTPTVTSSSQSPLAPQSNTNTPPSISSFTSSLQQFRRNIAETNWAQNSIGLAALNVAVIATFIYTYRSFKLARWTSWKDFLDQCWNEKNYGNESSMCRTALTKHLKPPPYSDSFLTTRSTKGWMQDAGAILLKRMNLSHKHEDEFGRTPHITIIAFYSLFAMAALALGWCWLRFQRRRRLERQRLQMLSSPPNNARSPSIAIVPSQANGEQKGTRRRIVGPKALGLSKTLDTYQDNRGGHEHRLKSFQDDWDELFNNPEWRKRNLGGFLQDAKIALQDIDEESLQSAFTTGSDANSDSASVLNRFKQKIREKLHHSDSDDAPFTALGVTSPLHPDSGSEDENELSKKFHKKRKSKVKTGATAFGVAHSGAALGASVGGDVGQELLVKEIADGDLTMPQTPQDTSLALTATNE